MQLWADGMANDPALSILSFDLDVGLGRTHRYLTNSSLVAHRFGFGMSYHRFSYEALDVKQLRDGGLNVTVTVTLKDSALDVASLATAGAGEIVQLYISGASVPGLVTPVQNLVGFSRIELGAHIGAAQHVTMRVNRTSLETAMADGTRRVVPGVYTLSAGGHQPNDPEGDSGTSGKNVDLKVLLK